MLSTLVHTMISHYKRGYKLALHNAESLFSCAMLAAEKSHFGTACSLNILAAEEAIKASFLLLKHHHPEAEIDGDINGKKLFTDHKTKHEHITFLTLLFKIMIQQSYELYEKNKATLDLVKTLPEHEAKKVKFKYRILYKIIEQVQKEHKKINKLDEAIKWWKSANTQKNKGFYVDEINGKWISPQIFEKKTYDTESEYVRIIIDYVKNMNKLFVFPRFAKIIFKIVPKE